MRTSVMGRFRHEPCVVLGATSFSFSGMAMADRLGAIIDPGPSGMAMADRLGARLDPGPSGMAMADRLGARFDPGLSGWVDPGGASIDLHLFLTVDLFS